MNHLKKGTILLFSIILFLLYPLSEIKTQDDIYNNNQIKSVLVIEPEYKINKIEYGIVSFYGKAHHGRKTANGERFHMDSLTAAHKKLPFGTLIRVVNLNNDKSVIVRITDRGPNMKSRILDISEGAAKIIGNTGLVKCRLEILINQID